MNLTLKISFLEPNLQQRPDSNRNQNKKFLSIRGVVSLASSVANECTPTANMPIRTNRINHMRFPNWSSIKLTIQILCYWGSRVAQQSKALPLSARGLTAVPGSVPASLWCICCCWTRSYRIYFYDWTHLRHALYCISLTVSGSEHKHLPTDSN